MHNTFFRDGTILSHGSFGSGTTGYTADFNGANLIGAATRSGTYMDQVTFLTVSITGAFKMFGPYGGTGGTSAVTFGEIQAFFGQSNSGIDKLGFKGKLFT